MEKNNKLFISLLFLTVIVVSISIVSATVTLVSPDASSTNNGIVVYNITNSSGFEQAVNCTLYASSVSTANNSIVSLNTTENDTASSLFINGSFVSSVLEDSIDYVFFASCWNLSSDQENSSTNTAITIDNTIPQAASSLSPIDKAKVTAGAVTFSGTVTGANTTGCTLQFSGILPNSGNSQTMTHTGDTCSLTLSNIPDQTYNWFIRASDGTNTTDSSTIAVQADVTTSAGKAAFLIQQEGVTSKGGATLSISGSEESVIGNLSGKQIGLIIVAILGIAWFVMRKKK